MRMLFWREWESDFAPTPAQQERPLLLLAGVFVLVNQIALILARDRAWTAIWPVGVWALCVLIGHGALNRRLPGRDPLLFPLVMFLTGWGLNLIARLVPSYAARQTLWMVIGLAALLLVTLLPRDLRWLRRYRYTWLIGGLALLAITILIGENPSSDIGPRLWLWAGFGRIYYQPSELLKILLVVFLASYFSEHRHFLREETVQIGPWRVPAPALLAPVLLMWGLCVIVLVWQRDLGAATLFFAVFMVMLYLASGQGQIFIAGAILLLIAAVAAYVSYDVLARRVDIWFNPWATADSDAYQ
ncbi:MAG: FtsW/RodA/SpoVE family cell cycle protein, partial [Anaerolineae bacterium]|nr:FtsW/RodA/SpoVE family cell cycle protein [Anaerolineae bacterium]